MATVTSITLAGGIKAPEGPAAHAAVPPVALSPAHAAFLVLSDALADANAAEEFRRSAASWDPAFSAHDAEAAIETVMQAARNAGDAQIVIKSDRSMIYAARFITCAMSVEDGGDREHILHFMTTHQPLLAHGAGGLVARQTNHLIGVAFERLLRLNELLDPSCSETSEVEEAEENSGPTC